MGRSRRSVATDSHLCGPEEASLSRCRRAPTGRQPGDGRTDPAEDRRADGRQRRTAEGTRALCRAPSQCVDSLRRRRPGRQTDSLRQMPPSRRSLPVRLANRRRRRAGAGCWPPPLRAGKKDSDRSANAASSEQRWSKASWAAARSRGRKYDVVLSEADSHSMGSVPRSTRSARTGSSRAASAVAAGQGPGRDDGGPIGRPWPGARRRAARRLRRPSPRSIVRHQYKGDFKGYVSPGSALRR